MLSDLRFALRQLLKTPGFALVAILSLGLGIGANTAVFSVVNAVLLRLLPVADPQQLVLFNWLAEGDTRPSSISGWVTGDPATGHSTSTSFSLQTFEALRMHRDTLASVFAFAPIFSGVNVNADGDAEVVRNAQYASGGYHRGLGVTAAAGRLLTEDDDQPAAPGVAVISYRYWQRRFGGDPGVIGKAILVDNVPVTLIGVTAPRFSGTMQVGEYTDITLPLSLEPRISRQPNAGRDPSFWWVRIMGRLNPGLSAVQAQASLEGIFQETARGHVFVSRKVGRPASGQPDPTSLRLRAESGAQGLVEARREQQRTLTILLAVVALVLLVACVNVANLLLARSAARRREIAVRLSVGASRGRVVRQLLTESVLLALLGAGVGLLFALWGRDTLLRLQPLGSADLALDASLDLRVLAFTCATAVVTGILFGLAPALRATRLDLAAEFQGGTRTVGGARSTLAKSLMVVQVALSLVLLVGAGLFVRTLRNLEQVDVGFDREHLLLFNVNAIANGTPRAQAGAVYDRIAERLAAVPGVQHAGYSQIPLLTKASWSSGVTVPGPSGPTTVNVRVNGIDPGFLATLRLPLVRGRAFTDRDTPAAPKVVIINQALARACFGSDDVIGRQLGFDSKTPNVEVVGVVRDAQYFNVRAAPPPTLYLPYAQLENGGTGNFAVRLAATPGAILPAIRAAIHEIDATLPLVDVRTQDEQIERLFASERLFANLCSAFGVLALILVAVGLYGLMAYAVTQRTGEIGVRMALGALPARVVWMIVRESLQLVGLGLLVGIAGALATSRLITGMLFGLSVADPLTYGIGTVLLAVVAVLAAVLPARRAARVNPVVALRAG